jgi:hypothetical protein
MQLTNFRKRELSDLAEFIADDFCPNGIILPEKIAIESGITYNCKNYKDCFDGLLKHELGQFHIFINSKSDNNERIRFSFAHELGHYFIDEHRNALIKGKSLHKSYNQYFRRNIVELEADFFSSNLLMPKCRFLKSIGNKKFNADLINSLKSEYGISFTACAIRLIDIDTHPIIIIFAENGYVKWKFSSSDFPYKWLLNDNVVPKDTVMGEYFYQNKTDDIKKTVTLWAIDWFNYVKDGDIQRKFYEYCIAHKNSALSVIWED